jgi:DNA-binding protein Fis
MLETIPDRTITASLNVAKYVDWLKKSFRDSKEILENYLDHWDMSLSSSYTHTRNFFPRFVPTLNLMSTNLREYIQLEVETIAIDQAQKVSLEELTLMLNEKTPQATKYVFTDYAEKSLNQFLQDINNMLPENIRKEKLFPYLKIADAYLPLEDHLMKYPNQRDKGLEKFQHGTCLPCWKKGRKDNSKNRKSDN